MKHLNAEELYGFVKALPEGQAETLAHLLVCSRCRNRVVSVASVPGEEILSPALLGLVLLTVGKQAGSHRQEQAAAGPLFNELLGHPPDLREQAVLEDPRFQARGVAELVLGAAGEILPDEPRRADRLCALSLTIQDHLEVRVSRNVLDCLAARAWTIRADSWRLRGEMEGAEEALSTAEARLFAEPLDAIERAYLCRSLALLRKEQGRFDEALGLFARAAGLFEAVDASEELGETLSLTGWLYLEELEPDLAARSLFPAVALLRTALLPPSRLHAVHGLALAYADLGKASAARKLVQAHESDTWGTVRDQLCGAWIRGQVMARTDNFSAAAPVLEAAFHGLLAEGYTYEAVLAALDLALAYAHENKLEGIGEVWESLVSPATAGRISPSCWEAVSFGLALTSRSIPFPNAPQVLEAVRDFVARGWHNPSSRFTPRKEVHAEMPWDDLDPELRQALCASAGVPLDSSEKAAGDIEPPVRNLISWTVEASVGVRIIFGVGQ